MRVESRELRVESQKGKEDSSRGYPLAREAPFRLGRQEPAEQCVPRQEPGNKLTWEQVDLAFRVRIAFLWLLTLDPRLSTLPYPNILFHRSRFHCTFSAGVILLKSGSLGSPLSAGLAAPPPLLS